MRNSAGWRLQAALFCVCASLVAAAHAQPKTADAYPNRPIRIIVTVPAGGSVDSATRSMGQRLSDRSGIAVVVDNRAGGTGTIAMTLTAQSAPDGYTVMSASNSMLVTGVLKKVPFDIRKAYDPVVQMTASAYALVVTPSLPVKSVKDLIAYAKAKPDALSFGSPGVGSIIHLSTAILAFNSGIKMVHVPYKGNSIAIVDLLAGRIHVLVAAPVGVAPHIKTGRLRGIATTGAKRVAALPDIPTLAESGVQGLVLDNMYGLYAPAGVPAAVLAALNREVGEVMNTQEMRERMNADGFESAARHTPAEFRRVVNAQIDQWDKFIRTSGIRID